MSTETAKAAFEALLLQIEDWQIPSPLGTEWRWMSAKCGTTGHLGGSRAPFPDRYFTNTWRAWDASFPLNDAWVANQVGKHGIQFHFTFVQEERNVFIRSGTDSFFKGAAWGTQKSIISNRCPSLTFLIEGNE